MSDLFATLERYYDAVPRRFARVEECGPFTLFLGEPGGWVYYARPRLGGADRIGAADVAAATGRLRELGLPEVVEWVHETTPTLLDAVRADGGLAVEETPLLVLAAGQRVAAVPLPDGVRVRNLDAGDRPGVSAARAVADLAFASGGTERGATGPAQREAALAPAQRTVLGLLAEGALHLVVAESETEGVLATARALPINAVAEVVGVATLPSARRRGLGAAVTAALLSSLRAAGVRTVFLTASSPAVARVYERIGFRRAGTGYGAQR